jgi:hypothetical protein
VKRKEIGFLILLTFGALLVHGYHPRAEDAEIYVPAIVRILHPSYYPFGREFFEANSHLTLFPHLIAWTVRFAHLSLDWALFLWYLASIFLFLLASWKIASRCFSTAAGRWGAVTMIAALLTLPVAGTSLYIFDEYLNPRSISAFAVLFAIDATLNKKYLLTALWLSITAVIHPFMTVFGLFFIVLLLILEKFQQRSPAATTAALLPFLSISRIFGKEPSAAYWRCLEDHRYYFLLRWEWYEWLGILAPLAFLWWFVRIARQRGNAAFERLAEATLVFEVVCFAAGLIVTVPHSLEILTPYQPMRSLQLVYALFFLFIGGLVGDFILKNHVVRWLLLFVPLCAAMCFAQAQLFPATRHVECPGVAPENPWLKAFVWIRGNTPPDAIFALDPHYMALPDENYQGFRANAERARLADAEKDWSAAVLYPWLPLADDCQTQVRAADGWKDFGPADFERLKKTYGVTWVVVQEPAPAGMRCAYRNATAAVCPIP